MLTRFHARARKLLAVVALTTASCVFAAPLAGILHEATVRHVACAEHGELVDAAPLTAAELAAPVHHHARTVVEQGESAPSGLEDTHCLLASWSHQRTTPASDQPTAARPPQLAEAPHANVPDRRLPAIPLYLLAPKLSPPLA